MKPRRLLAVGFAAIVGVCVATPRIAHHFVFPGGGRAESAPSDVRVHSLTSRDGARVHALELVAPRGGRTVVWFHNNRETVEGCLGLARALRAAGFGVLLVEYRGYGASEATDPSEAALYDDADAALDMLALRGQGADRIVLLGTSLGTGIAAEMARRGRGARLVLVTPYTSLPDLVTDVAPLVPAGHMLADHFDTLAKSPSIAIPTLVIHGDADEVVPFWMGERVARSIPNARLVRVRGGRHGDLFARERARLLAELSAHSAS